MVLHDDIGSVLRDAATFPTRIGSHADVDDRLGKAVKTGLHLGAKVLAAGVHVGEAMARPAEAAMRAAGIEIEPSHSADGDVRYDFFSGIGPEIERPGGVLPGANEWDRAVSEHHPNPVVLMHGTAGGAQTNWGVYVPLLVKEGFSPFTLTFGAHTSAPWPLSALGGLAPIEDSAAEFGDFVSRVLLATGSQKVDVIGHSQGTVVTAYYAKFLGGADKLGTVVSLAPMWRGSQALVTKLGGPVELSIALGGTHRLHFPAAAQLAHDSDFFRRLNADGGPYVSGVRYVNMSTRYDEFVRPYTSGQHPGRPGDDVINIVVQESCESDFSDHLGIAGSRRAARMVLNALDGSDDPASGPRDVPCEVVPPIVG